MDVFDRVLISNRTLQTGDRVAVWLAEDGSFHLVTFDHEQYTMALAELNTLDLKVLLVDILLALKARKSQEDAKVPA